MSFDHIDWTTTRTDAEWEALAVQFENQARDSYAAREESWERCDTDGYLSQWASGITADGYRCAAELARNHGLVETTALFFADGRIASTHHKWGQFGPFWVLNDEAAALHGKRFLSESKARKAATRAANLAKKGFSVGRIRVAGRVFIPEGSSITSARYGAYADWRALRDGAFTVLAFTGGDDYDPD